MIRRSTIVVACMLAALLFGAGRASAHPIGYSAFYSELEGSAVRVSFDLHLLTVANVMPDLDTDRDRILSAEEIARGAPRITRHLDEALEVRADGERCEPEAPYGLRPIAGERLKLSRRYRCPHEPERLDWRVDLLMEDEGGHTVVGRFRTPAGYEQFVFRRGMDRHDVVAEPTVASRSGTQGPGPNGPAERGLVQTFVASVGLGVRHVLGGVDHVLFVLALLFAIRGARELAATVTSFTVAHSVTLGLVALRIVSLPPRLVESAIALSIVWVAAENLLGRAPRRRLGVAFAFGLVHGLGLGGALAELGLPAGGWVPALAGFNIGVELGQVAALAVAFPLLYLVGRWPSARQRVALVGNSGIALVGALWLVDRALALRFMPF